MNKRELTLEKNEQKNEYNFNEGAEEILRRTEDLLVNQDYVVITIHGSGINVGKTFLDGKLSRNLREREIQVLSFGSDIDKYGSVKPQPLPLNAVIIFGAVSMEGASVPKKIKN